MKLYIDLYKPTNFDDVVGNEAEEVDFTIISTVQLSMKAGIVGDTFTVSGYSAGSVSVRHGTSYTGTARSSNGTFTEDLMQHFQYDNNALAADASFVGSIDNFSVRRKKI